MTMSMTKLSPEILALSVEDRIQLAMAIWDSVAQETIELSDENKQLLDERLRQHEANPDEGESWEVVRAKLFNEK
jgi:putative addiction module component (TIGR02574 family)